MIEITVKFKLDGEELEPFEQFLENKKKELAEQTLEKRLEAMSRTRLIIIGFRDMLQAAYDDGYLDGSFNVVDVRETPLESRKADSSA